MTPGTPVVYWDTSAILSALFQDEHSPNATAQAQAPGTHLISSLAWAEAHGVIARIEREGIVATAFIEAAREALERGPWRRVNVTPNAKTIATLARTWPLRGADLWHLGAANELQTELPELRLLSFDARLATAATGEGLA